MSSHSPIDPLRMRIFSELNLRLSQHGIEKETVHETSKHLAFLSRYYLSTPSPNPHSISVPIIDIPVVGPAGDVAMEHKIALVVHLPPPSATSTPARKIAGARHCPSPSAEPRIKVFIQMIGTLGHRKRLIGGFGAIAERVIGGLLTGQEEIVSAALEGAAGKKKKKKEKKKKKKGDSGLA